MNFFKSFIFHLIYISGKTFAKFGTEFEPSFGKIIFSEIVVTLKP